MSKTQAKKPAQTKADLESQVKGLEAKTRGLQADLNKVVANSVPKERLSSETIIQKLRWWLDGKQAIWKVVLTILGVVVPIIFTGHTVAEGVEFVMEWSGKISEFITEWTGVAIEIIAIVAGFITGGTVGLVDPRTRQ